MPATLNTWPFNSAQVQLPLPSVPPMNIKAAVLKFVVSKPPFGVRYSLGRVDKQPPSNGFLYAVSIGVFASVIHFYDTYTINTGALTVNSVSVIS